jgi:hypothetical protein
MSKFATALKEQAGLSGHAVRTPETKAGEAARARARDGAKHIGGYFAPEVSKQLRALAVAEDTTVQDLLAEALNMLFQSRRLSMIAAMSKDHTTLSSRQLPAIIPGDDV